MAVATKEHLKELERRADLARRVVLPEDVKAWRAERGAAPSLGVELLLVAFLLAGAAFVRTVDAYDEEASRPSILGPAVAFLDPSAHPANLEECMRAHPERARPDGAISFAQAPGGLYLSRACYWQAPRKAA